MLHTYMRGHHPAHAACSRCRLPPRPPSAAQVEGALPPPRGNHSAAVVADRLWLFGGDAANAGVLPHTVWSLALAAPTESDPPMSWAAVSATGEPAPPSCDHAAVAIGTRVLLLGGSNANGYLSFSRIPVFHTDTLSWSRMACGGDVPGARAGHVSVASFGGAQSGGNWQLYVFGGGNSTSGFNDLHVLRDSGKWRRLTSATRTSDPAAQPQATEGAAIAQSGGMLLVFGGYTAAGATKKCYAWGCEDEVGGGSAAVAVAAGGVKAAGGGGLGGGKAGAEGLVVLACPEETNTQRHAHAAQGAFAEKLSGGAQVVAAPGSSGSAGAGDVTEASSNEQALSLMLQRLHNLQLQHSAFGGVSSSSLLARARMLAAVQPCVYRLMVGGAPRTFVCFWIGAVDLATGRQAVGSSLSREVGASEAGGWGKAAHSASALNEDGASALVQAWKSLLRGI